jgi:coenzyme F420-reducing hydrogenase beta subunit
MSEQILNVVSAGVCVGCGVCQAVAPTQVEVRLGRDGTYLPAPTDGRELREVAAELPKVIDAVCPFSPSAANEDAIGLARFGDTPRHPSIGHYRTIAAGHVAAGDFRTKGTSGGLTSWVLNELLRRGDVDAVVHVTSVDPTDGAGFSAYTISRSSDELLAGRKSRYHVQTMGEVLQEVREQPGRYAFVGVPCFAKAVRLLAAQDPVFGQRVTFVASLVCGHLKSTLFSEYLAWSLGVAPRDVAEIDYRHKEPDRPANRYSVRIDTRDGRSVVRGVEHVPMSDWGIGLFKLGACDYCDDVVGETADISLGDAWLPPLMSDWRGANVAIARSARADELLQLGIESGELSLEPWTADQAAASQASGLRHRREGLAIRLGDRVRRGVWVPTKRVAPAPPAELDTALAHRMLNRQAIAVASGPAFLLARERGDLGVFHRSMRPLVRRYHGRPVVTTTMTALRWVLVRTPAPLERLLRRITGGRRWT